MRVIKANVLYLDKQGMTPYQFIEKIGRTCYKSEDKITEDSAVKFVKGLCNRKHFAMVEHYWVHLVVERDIPYALTELGLNDLKRYMHFSILEDGVTYMSCPLRVFFDHLDVMEDLDNPYIMPVQDMWQCVINEFPEIFGLEVRPVKLSVSLKEQEFCDKLASELRLLEATEEQVASELMKHRTHTIHFTCDRGVTHEIVRHRPCSFAQESQRYCNYGKENEVTFIEPLFFERWTDEKQNCQTEEYHVWSRSCEYAEKNYLKLLELGKKPQEARTVLPNSTKTEIILTTNESEWQHIVNLRYHGTTGAPHPQMVEVMTIAYAMLKESSGGRIK